MIWKPYNIWQVINAEAESVNTVPLTFITSDNVQGALEEIDDSLTVFSTQLGIWKSTSSFNSEPPSTSTITMTSDMTSIIKAGMPIKFVLGGTASNPGTYYAVCTAITSNLLTVAGAPLETDAGDLTSLYYDDVRPSVQLDFFIAGTYGDGIDTDLLQNDMNTTFKWQSSKAYLVTFSATQQAIDSGAEAKINIQINNAVVSTNDSNNGIQLGDAFAWVDNSAVAINTSNYDVNRNEEVEINCTAAGASGDGAELTVSTLWVME